jgi:nitroimidazol reductase NimA-like FMN-containing flavoprotein (pyridoxamine 5'-phosphate oxidase superfamily)
MDDLIKEAAKVIKNQLYINLATVTPKGKPWNTPVYCAYNKDLNYYWFSWKKNQHSVNIRKNPSVFATVYDSTVPAGTGFGVYFQGKAYELTNLKTIMTGIRVVYGREKRKPRDISQFLKKFPRRIYQFKPNKVWVNGDGDMNGNFIDIRTELNLTRLKKEV